MRVAVGEARIWALESACGRFRGVVRCGGADRLWDRELQVSALILRWILVGDGYVHRSSS